MRLIELMASRTHPVSHFATGTSETLNVDNIVNLVSTFWKDNYKAENMRLVVYGSADTDTLANWVKNYFSDIRSGKVTKEKFGKPYTELGKVVYTPLIGFGQEMHISFPLPSQFNYIKEQPADFIAYLLEHYGVGGLEVGLEEYVLSFEASAEINYNDFSMLEINVELRESGLENWKMVAGTIFEYISLI